MPKPSKIVAVQYKRNVGWWHWLFMERITGYGVNAAGYRETDFHSANTVRGLYRVVRREERNKQERWRNA